MAGKRLAAATPEVLDKYPTLSGRRTLFAQPSHSSLVLFVCLDKGVQCPGVVNGHDVLLVGWKASRSIRTMRTSGKSQRVQDLGYKAELREATRGRERPAQVTDRVVPGHWEGDLLCGGTRSQIATLVERHSRFGMLVKLSAKDSATVVNALSTQMRRLPTQLRRSLTWDRGLELVEHKRFSCATDIQFFFCDPHSPPATR
jgi:IS30 family transposase